MPPGGGRHGAVAAALCLALGSTALLTWAFSIFAEDKKKKVGNSSIPDTTPTKRPDGQVKSARNVQSVESLTASNASITAFKEQKEYSKPDCLKSTERDDEAYIVIENKSAHDLEERAGYRYPSYEKFKTPLQDPEGKMRQLPLPDHAIAKPTEAPANYLQHVPKFDEKYSSALTRTSIADTVIIERISAVESSPPSLQHQISQLDNKVTTYEERLPDTQEIPPEELENSAVSIQSSVSCKSLEKAVMYPPTPKIKSASFSGVENSIDEMDVREVTETISPNLQDALYPNTSMEMSPKMFGKTHVYTERLKQTAPGKVSEPKNRSSDGVDVSVATMDSGIVLSELLIEDSPSHSQSRGHNKTLTMPTTDHSRIIEEEGVSPVDVTDSVITAATVEKLQSTPQKSKNRSSDGVDVSVATMDSGIVSSELLIEDGSSHSQSRGHNKTLTMPTTGDSSIEGEGVLVVDVTDSVITADTVNKSQSTPQKSKNRSSDGVDVSVATMDSGIVSSELLIEDSPSHSQSRGHNKALTMPTTGDSSIEGEGVLVVDVTGSVITADTMKKSQSTPQNVKNSNSNSADMSVATMNSGSVSNELIIEDGLSQAEPRGHNKTLTMPATDDSSIEGEGVSPVDVTDSVITADSVKKLQSTPQNAKNSNSNSVDMSVATMNSGSVSNELIIEDGSSQAQPRGHNKTYTMPATDDSSIEGEGVSPVDVADSVITADTVNKSQSTPQSMPVTIKLTSNETAETASELAIEAPGTNRVENDLYSKSMKDFDADSLDVNDNIESMQDSISKTPNSSGVVTNVTDSSPQNEDYVDAKPVAGVDSAEVHSAEVSAAINNDSITGVTRYLPPKLLEMELSADSLEIDVSHDLLNSKNNQRSLERSEMKFLIGVDKNLSSSRSGSSSNSPQRVCSSPGTRKSDLFVNIVADDDVFPEKLEKSEYYAPSRIERELTPDHTKNSIDILNDSRCPGSPGTLNRSELYIQITGQKVAVVDDDIENILSVEATHSKCIPSAGEMGHRSVEHIPSAADAYTKNIPSAKHAHTDLSGTKLETGPRNIPEGAEVHIECMPAAENWLSGLVEVDAELPSEVRHSSVSDEQNEALGKRFRENGREVETTPDMNVSGNTNDSQTHTESPGNEASFDKADGRPLPLAEDTNVPPLKRINNEITPDMNVSGKTNDLQTHMESPGNEASFDKTDGRPLPLAEDTNVPPLKPINNEITPDMNVSGKPNDSQTHMESPGNEASFDKADGRPLPLAEDTNVPPLKPINNEITPDMNVSGKPNDSQTHTDSRGNEASSDNADGRPISMAEDTNVPSLKPINSKISTSPELVGVLESPSDEVAAAVDDISSISSGGVEYSRTQMTETEEMIETSVEETVTMVITGVAIYPGSDRETLLSMQDAVSQGILDLENGLYHNSNNGEKMPLIEAMNSGYIKMGPQKVEKSEELVKSVGIITIKTTRETMPYTVKGAKDTRDGKMYHVFQATRRKILDADKGTFTDLQTGSKMLIGDAVDLKLVEIEYDMNASGLMQEEITKTYSVHGVVDQKEKSKLSFHEAVSRGLIDPDTGEYINNITGLRVSVEDAIDKGFIKATQTDNAENISVDDMGSRVAEKGVDVIRKKILGPLKVLKGMKH